MSSVAPTAAEQPPIFHAVAERTPLQASVATGFGEELAVSGFLVLPSRMEGFVQAGAPVEEHGVVNLKFTDLLPQFPDSPFATRISIFKTKLLNT